jgi:hypothetical protein
MAQVGEPREYETNSHNNKNRPAEPLGRRLFIWPRPTYEGRIECVRSKPEYDPHNSYKYLNNPPCHECFLS